MARFSDFEGDWARHFLDMPMPTYESTPWIQPLVGLRGLTVADADQMASVSIDVASGEPYEVPAGARHEPPPLVRYLSDDLNVFHLEAAAAQLRSRRPSAHELNSWLYAKTVFGSVLDDARDALESQDDRATRLLGFSLVPQVYRECPASVS